VALDVEGCDPDPVAQFRAWFAEAQAAGVHEPEAMALATSDPLCGPTVRMVLLRGVGPEGFSFYTNYGSLKGRQLDADPRASLLFHWHPPGRQVRVEGTVARMSEEESKRYFDSRPRGHRIGTWASMQGTTIPDRAHLERRVAEAEARFGGGAVPLPPYWGGYRVAPTAMEFWEARDDRLHDRVVYLPDGDGAWTRSRLSP
jgi:pyridoxamine 5'-phosphate oxidase